VVALRDGAHDRAVVGGDGRASSTIEFDGAAGFHQGLTHIGDTVYVLGEDASGDAMLFRVELP